MNIFSSYAAYYDLLYRDKDYAGEAAFVLEELARFGARPQSLLDLGCGTGRHAMEFARQGTEVVGVDLSETMLALGERALAGTTLPVRLVQGDARSVRLGRTFDAVSSLFHVMSYQNTEEDALAEFRTAWEHLAPGGLFLFDFWYGPGVLTDPPVRRERVLEDEKAHIQRSAVPEQRLADNMVVVNYTITVTDKATNNATTIKEAHAMRYWFLPELRQLSRQSGFIPLHAGAWLSEEPLEGAPWNGYMVVRKNA